MRPAAIPVMIVFGVPCRGTEIPNLHLNMAHLQVRARSRRVAANAVAGGRNRYAIPSAFVLHNADQQHATQPEAPSYKPVQQPPSIAEWFG